MSVPFVGLMMMMMLYVVYYIINIYDMGSIAGELLEFLKINYHIITKLV